MMYFAERRVDIDQEHERRRLRKERERLNRQIARLVAASVLMNDADDPLLREQHQDELERHQHEFRAFRADLERFHHRYGPLGE